VGFLKCRTYPGTGHRGADAGRPAWRAWRHAGGTHTAVPGQVGLVQTAGPAGASGERDGAGVPPVLLDGHRVKAPLEYGRSTESTEKVWVYGGLRPCDGHAITLTARARDSAGYQQLLAAVAAANPTGSRRSSPTTSPATPVSPPAPGWPTIPASARCSSQGCVLAQPPRRLVATVPPCGAGRPDLRRSQGDHPRHRGGDLPAEWPGRPWVWGRPAPSPRYLSPDGTSAGGCLIEREC
jgi:hypothetical protein